MSRLLVWICCAASVVAPPLVHRAAAGESRGVIAVTARVVDACSVSAPDLVADGSATDATVDHRCTTSTATVPHTVSVRATDPATDPGGAPTQTVQRAAGGAGETLIVTVTY